MYATSHTIDHIKRSCLFVCTDERIRPNRHLFRSCAGRTVRRDSRHFYVVGLVVTDWMLCNDKSGCTCFRTGSTINVVIHLYIAYAVFLDETSDDAVCIGAHPRIVEIELIAIMVNDRPFVAAEKPFFRHLSCDRAVNAHHLALRP